MRQIAVTDKKLRGILRRLRALARWADSFCGFAVPRSPEGELFLNWKIPGHGALVQGFCMAAAARRQAPGRGAPPRRRLRNRHVPYGAWPWLHQSEVAVFYDADCHRGLAGNGNPLTARRLSMELGFEIPAGFVEHSVDVTQPDGALRVEWGTIGESLR